jgi:hypothetical protein
VQRSEHRRDHHMTEQGGFCEACGHRASWVMAETGPPARLAFFCEEHIEIASRAPLAAIEDAVHACSGANDCLLTAVWQRISDRYPDPVRLDADLRAQAGIPPFASWDVLRRPPMSATHIGITARIQNWPHSPRDDERPHDDDT